MAGLLTALGTGYGAGQALAQTAARKGDRDFGEYLSSQCTTCHQITGQSAGGVPPIIAWPDDQFIAVLQSYKEKVRESQVMQAITARLSQEEIEALASYFGALPNQPGLK